MISSLADRLLSRLVPRVSAAASASSSQDVICFWSGCTGNPCLARYCCCVTEVGICFCDPCTWTC